MKAIRRHKRVSSESLYRFVRRCRLEIRKCEKVNAYLAAIILLGSALEYLLTAWIRAYPEVVYSQRKKLTDHWDLRTLNTLAYQSGFWEYRAFQAAERIRKFRNMVHPNWYAGRKPLRFVKSIVEDRMADFDIVTDSFQRNL